MTLSRPGVRCQNTCGSISTLAGIRQDCRIERHAEKVDHRASSHIRAPPQVCGAVLRSRMLRDELRLPVVTSESADRRQ